MGHDVPLLPLIISLLGFAGIVVWHLQGRSRPTARLIAQIAFFAAMTAVLGYVRASPFHYDPSGIDGASALLILAKVLWWIHLAWALIGFVRIYIVLDHRPRQARLIQDLIVATVYLGVSLSIMAFVFGVPIGTLMATSGVIAIIIGLALQNTLSDVFSGIALTLGRPYVIGDWISLSDGTEGRVMASNWRSTHLLTAAHNVVVLPNSVLAKLGLTNVSQPDENHQLALPVRVTPTRMPRTIVEVMRDVLASSNVIVKQPSPNVVLLGIDASAVTVELQFRVASPAQRGEARNEVIDLVYRHCKASGLELAMPPEAVVVSKDSVRLADRPAPEALGLVEAVSTFAVLSSDERTSLASMAMQRTFAAEAEIVRAGETLTRLMIVRSGIVAMMRDDQEIARLAPGDFFGEQGLLAGVAEMHTLQAVTRVVVYEIDKDAFAPLLIERPELAEDLAANLACRSRLAERPVTSINAGDGRASDLLKRIRLLIRLNRGYGESTRSRH
ncbi:cyclic nucleotide-binding domain-containing protein [Mycoplana rhizolycopersici]|uniref:Small-conductance mechanosensitive channel n=1 Tax=Mycoplana rhizolycopersici TaxID=2746702 RepID=A0ABX2QN35_9HYPH|nr:mechanosensitive ion channel family protein [Rhizobium rhizolycopersici]NVP58294.1 mechanosensitive ion channel [Rhizobium rhizolycopersici]